MRKIQNGLSIFQQTLINKFTLQNKIFEYYILVVHNNAKETCRILYKIKFLKCTFLFRTLVITSCTKKLLEYCYSNYNLNVYNIVFI